MKKFWHSGMIDKKVIEKRKQDDYMNKLHRTILELSIKQPEPEPWYRHPEMRALLDRLMIREAIEEEDLAEKTLITSVLAEMKKDNEIF